MLDRDDPETESAELRRQPSRAAHPRRGSGGPAARPCRPAGGRRRPRGRRRHRRPRSHVRPAPAGHARRADQPLALRGAQGRHRAERTGPLRRHDQGRQELPRHPGRRDHPGAPPRRRRQGQGAAGRRTQGRRPRGRLPEDDQTGRAALLRTVGVPGPGPFRDPRGVPGAGRLHRQRSAGARECGLPARRGRRGHDRRSDRRAVLHGTRRGLQLHHRRPCRRRPRGRRAGGAALVAVDRGRPRTDHQRPGAGRPGHRQALVGPRRAPADLARELGMPPWKIDRVRQQMRGWTPDGVAVALRAVAEADAGVKGAATTRSTSWSAPWSRWHGRPGCAADGCSAGPHSRRNGSRPLPPRAHMGDPGHAESPASVLGKDRGRASAQALVRRTRVANAGRVRRGVSYRSGRGAAGPGTTGWGWGSWRAP